MHRTSLLLALSSGCLLYLSQPPVDLGPLVLVAFVPWFVALRRTERPAEAFRLGLVVGLVVFLAGFHFLTRLAGVDLGPLVLHGMWLLVGGVLALYFGAFAFVAHYVLKRPAHLWPVLLPLAWTLLELPRYSVPAPAPVFFPGYSLHRLPALIQTADLGGVHAVSFFVVAVNAALFAALAARSRRRQVLAFGLVVVILVGLQLAYGLARLDQIRSELRHDGPRVALVQPNVPQAEKNRDDDETRRRLWRQHRDRTLELRGQRADLVVWPETSFPWTLDPWGEPAVADLPETAPGPLPDDADPRRLAQELGTTLVVGAYTQLHPVVAEARPEAAWVSPQRLAHNSAWAFDADGQTVGRHDKVYLVPGAERMPLVGSPTGRALAGIAGAFGPALRETTQLVPGSTAEIAALRDPRGRTFRFSMNVCFEFAFPQLFARLHRQETPHFSVALSNEAWYRDSSELDHALVMTRFRAIESRTTLVRAANTGITAVIDPTGTVAARLTDPSGADRLFAGTLVVAIPYLPNPKTTFFVRHVG